MLIRPPDPLDHRHRLVGRGLAPRLGERQEERLGIGRHCAQIRCDRLDAFVIYGHGGLEEAAAAGGPKAGKMGSMSDYLYCCAIVDGSSSPDWSKWIENASEMNAKTGDYGPLQSIVVIKAESVIDLKRRLTRGFIDPHGVDVSEITKDTLKDEHRGYTNLANKYFKPYGDFVNL